MYTRIADQIRDSIMDGTYLPRQKLVVDDVARSLNVSTMPVREAMIALANEGLLDVLSRRGFAVGQMRRSDLEDILSVHAFVAGVFAERAAKVIDETILKQLYLIQAEITDAARGAPNEWDRGRIGDLNFEFHRKINALVQANRLAWFLRAVTRYVPRDVYQKVEGWAELAVQDHPSILEALHARDGVWARELTELHVRRAGEKLIEHLDSRGFWQIVDSGL
jgi:DNA-binding GntR family transcriptional regulator